MADRREGHFKGFQGTDLFYQSWIVRQARGTLVITHGIGEHSESYHRTASDLADLGWTVHAWDLRGHGRSEGKRGHVDDFRHYSLDLGLYLRFLNDTGRLNRPFALVGHSMGGLVTLRFASDDGDRSGAGAIVLSSPLIGIKVPIPPLKEAAARLLNRWLPGMTLFNEIRYEDLTRDPEWLKTYNADPLRHDRISPSLYFGMLENIEYVSHRAPFIRLPVLIQASGRDGIVSRSATEKFFEIIGSKNKKLLIYQDSFHEVYNDLNRHQAYEDLDTFLAEALQIDKGQNHDPRKSPPPR